MIYFEFADSTEFNCQGHVKDSNFANNINERSKFSTVTKVEADGDELEQCCIILGRNLPYPCVRVYTFLGVNAQEIARNWRP
jgi:hypothetical protein